VQERLVEANGDFEEANTILRKRGLASAAKKAGRTANEGLIANRVAADHSSGILAEVNCESDFVARTPDFVQLMEQVLTEIEKAGDAANDAWAQGSARPGDPSRRTGHRKTGREHWACRGFARFAGKGLRRPVHSSGRQDRG